MNLILRNTVNILIFFGFIFIVFFNSCTSERKYKVLSFFFDGVPDPNAKNILAEINTKDSLASLAIALPKIKQEKPEFFIHKPYEEEKCSSCHEEGFSNRLIKPTPDLCYTCHQDFNTKYKVLHGPVASGYCTACHDHHMAKLPKLLLRPGQDLCLSCHEYRQVFQNPKHEKIGSKHCIECHNPHGGDDRAFLNSNSCFSCHDDFSKKYTFLHGPVASGNCNVCHVSHATKSAKLLVRESQDLCFYCHNSQQVLANPSHKNIKKANCISCHNPHGGYDRYSLKDLIQKTDFQKINLEKINPHKDSIIQKTLATENNFKTNETAEIIPITADSTRMAKINNGSDSLIFVKEDSSLQKFIKNVPELPMDRSLNSNEVSSMNLKDSESIETKNLDSPVANKFQELDKQAVNFDTIHILTMASNVPEKEGDKIKISEPLTDKIYIAKKGDYLYKIARELMLDPKELQRLNPEIKDFVKQGDVFILPKKTDNSKENYSIISENRNASPAIISENNPPKEVVKASKETILSSALDRNPKSVDYTTYLAKQGDYIYKIARAFNIPPKDLIDLNPDYLDKVFVGSKILLPLSLSQYQAKMDTIEKAESVITNAQISNRNFTIPSSANVLSKAISNEDVLDTVLFQKYTAKQGDYLYKIARDLNFSPVILMKINPQIKDLLFVGGKVIIPKVQFNNSNKVISLPENKNIKQQ